MRAPTEDEVAMAEALKASNDENRRLGQQRYVSYRGMLRYFMTMSVGLLGLSVLILIVLSAPSEAPSPAITYLPVVTPPPAPEVDRCCRMWSLVHGADDIHVEDGTGEIVVGFEYLTRALDVPEDMERLSGRQMRRVLWLAQELVDAHNQDVE